MALRLMKVLITVVVLGASLGAWNVISGFINEPNTFFVVGGMVGVVAVWAATLAILARLWRTEVRQLKGKASKWISELF